MKISNIKRFSLILLAFITLSLEIFSQNANKHYSIVEGDTAYSIAAKFGISLQELYDLNPWAKNPLKIGDRILLPDNAKVVKNTDISNSKTYIIGFNVFFFFLMHSRLHGTTKYDFQALIPFIWAPPS